LAAVGATLLGVGLTINSALWSIVGAVGTVVGLAMLVAAIFVGDAEKATRRPVTDGFTGTIPDDLSNDALSKMMDGDQPKSPGSSDTDRQ
jgi:hypothetical protein